MEKIKKYNCQECNEEIESINDGVIIIGDNYLQVTWLKDQPNIFCSNECVIKSLSIVTIYHYDDEYDDLSNDFHYTDEWGNLIIEDESEED